MYFIYDSKEYSVAEVAEMTGVSKATLYRRLNDNSA
ncbi:MAG: helix-turn-helix domain-containing protein [Dethiobacteria bacterium]|nr:helix-turn-helix domain-containing protein [Dethiobacteria bacterium]